LRWLPLAAAALGAWLILNGVAHDIGVWNVARADGRAYDLRYASLLALGVTLVAAGALQIWCASAMRRGEPWARGLSAATAGFVMVHIVLLIPIFPAWGLLAFHAGWLGVLAWERWGRSGSSAG
jgi:hypothetical protein